MMALFIKDWRLNLHATIAILSLYAIMPFLVFFSRLAEDSARHPALGAEYISLCLFVAAGASGGVSLFVIPAFGGIAFAKERRDRSAEFLAAQPIERGRIVLSKAVVGIALCLLPWILSGVVVAIAIGIRGWTNFYEFFDLADRSHAESLGWLAQVELMLFGFAWFLSSLVRSETLAAAITILTGVLLLIAYAVYRSRLDAVGMTAESEHFANAAGGFATWFLGLGGFIAGTIIALRRTSP